LVWLRQELEIFERKQKAQLRFEFLRWISAEIFNETVPANEHRASYTLPNSITMGESFMNGRHDAQTNLSHHALSISIDEFSRSTSPGNGFDASSSPTDKAKRYRPRTFPYFHLLPYPVEGEDERNAALQAILKHLYMAIKAEDFSPGAVHWTRELKGWLGLKFEITRELRVRLVKLYYMLSLAPGLDAAASERFLTMFVVLTKKKHYLKPGQDLILDWRPLWNEIKGLVLPGEMASHQNMRRRPSRNLSRFCMLAQLYVDPKERRAMFEEILPYFTTSEVSGAFIVAGVLNVLMPTTAAPDEEGQLQSPDYLPTLFHLWALVSRSHTFDITFIELFSRLARDMLSCTWVEFTEHGIFSKDQSDLIFTAILRLTEIPVGQASSPYSDSVDLGSGLSMYLEKDRKKNPVAYTIARWIVMSLSPVCLEKPGSILANLEGLIQSIDTFFHPSNQGGWTTMLSQLTFHLVDFFVMRWNREKSGEMDTPPERRLNNELKKRFVECLKEVTFMGIFAKSSKSLNYYLSALQGLAYLEPSVMLPGALQRFYPSLQGLVEVHRTSSSLRGLQMIAHVMSKEKGFRCHITALLALALPGIDANDLDKTMHTLTFFQAVAYSIPFVNLTKEDSGIHDTSLAMQWVQGEMERMESEGQDVQIDYQNELSDEDEANILRSSTAGFGEFVMALLGKIFTLLENLPDAARVRNGSPEENVINTLPAALTPLFASLSPDVFDIALEKLAAFVGGHVVHQARDAMAFMTSALCKANPAKTLRKFVPLLIVGIRSEIDQNGAASDRSSGTDVLPRDRALVWYISMLSLLVVHVGSDVVDYKKDLFDIALYMQEKCRGLPTIHISNFIHHLLLNLTTTYPVDNNLYEPSVLERGLDVSDWGRTTLPSELTIKWHRPLPEEIAFAIELFESQVDSAKERLADLMSDNPSVPRTGKNKVWSDEVSRNLIQLRLVISGLSSLFNPREASGQRKAAKPNGVQESQIDIDMKEADAEADEEDEEDEEDQVDEEVEVDEEEEDDTLSEGGDDEETRPQFHYQAGYLLVPDSPEFIHIHKLRMEVGELLSQMHEFLNKHQEDDVACFTALYSAYKTWITDVGTERSAHTLDRFSKLYNADIQPFKVSGLRKAYPRPLLIKRANVYNLQRVKHNASARQKCELDKTLLLQLAESSLSVYANVRRNAQSAQESALKVLIGGRPLVIPPLLKGFEQALETNDLDRVKGGIYTLLFTSLLRTMFKNWHFAPTLIRLYLKTCAVDKTSIQKLTGGALFTLIEFGRPLERIVILDDKLVATIEPSEPVDDAINARREFIVKRRAAVESKKAALAEELVEVLKVSHWAVASRCIMFVSNLGLRFETIAPKSFIETAALGAIDDHPGLRGGYSQVFSRIFAMIDLRAVYGHEYENYLREKEFEPNKLTIEVNKEDPSWTQEYLNSFADPQTPEYYVDSDHPGWLVWSKSFNAISARPKKFTAYDEVEIAARKQIGQLLTREWYAKFFAYLKQEPRDARADTFRMSHAMLLMHTFDLVYEGLTQATLEDIKELVEVVYEDGSDKHQHRATAEIIGALLAGVMEEPVEYRNRVWSYAVPIMQKVFSDGLTPENIGYWMTCLHLLTGSKDPRRSREIVDKLAAFRLDMTSNAAFKESSKIQLLEFAISDAGWHFRLEKPIVEDFIEHIDHPYKSVREAMGRTLATIFRTRYYEAFKDVNTLLEKNKEASTLGIQPYKPTEEFSAMVKGIFERLIVWRAERTPGQQTPSSYTSGGKTVMLWLDNTLNSYECTQLLDFFPDVFMEELLHMMDVKEDIELQRLAYHVYRLLPNIPFRAGADSAFIEALIRIGKTSSSWHQRLRTLINMQVIYFRRIFLVRPAEQSALFEAVSDMLEDTQLEVRIGAASTLAGMIRCSPIALRNAVIKELIDKFTLRLKQNPMPKKTPGTDTPVSHTKQVIRRHAAVLGLGSLVQAFPYQTPPPEWMPGVLAMLASRVASDPGAIGKTVKSVLADFKKTRQDTWVTDQKVCFV
jgi:proteasome activator subunit 4